MTSIMKAIDHLSTDDRNASMLFLSGKKTLPELILPPPLPPKDFPMVLMMPPQSLPETSRSVSSLPRRLPAALRAVSLSGRLFAVLRSDSSKTVLEFKSARAIIPVTEADIFLLR